MNGLIISDKCTLCGKCLEVCPFDALDLANGRIQVNGNCRLCGICVKQCPEKAISLQTRKTIVNKTEWQGVMVFGEYTDQVLHPVTIELIGKAKELTGKTNMNVSVVLVGYNLGETAEQLLAYGVSHVYAYDDKALANFRVDTYANVLTDIIGDIKPSVVLVGGTSIGRSLAPRVATRFRTGLTADCTHLDIKDNTDLELVQTLAGLLGGQMASTRPMVEKGWLDYTKQIGLSGRTVKPKLIITCGVSGAIQFCACMNGADLIIAINRDPAAPIFKIAHYGIVGDLYKVIPELIERIEGSVQHVV